MDSGPFQVEAPRTERAVLPPGLRWLTPWVEAGVREDMPLLLRKRVRITNMVGLVSGMAMLIYWPIDILSGMGLLTIPMVIVNLTFLLVPVMNRSGHYLFSRLAMTTAMNAGIAFYLAAYGPAIHMHYFFLCSFCLAVTVFRTSERWAFLYALGLPVFFGISVGAYLLFSPPFAEPLPSEWEAVLALANSIASAGIIVGLLTFIIVQNERNEKELSAQAVEFEQLYQRGEAVNQELQVSRQDLQLQQVKLAATNEQLLEQQEQLAAANEELQSQQEALAAANEELRAQQESVSSINDELRERSALLERANEEVRRKAAEVERASRVKSEFLANMSHELRTPLNSMLLLSQDLSDNRLGHLDEDEVQCARIVHEAGEDLLVLINDILDLSKVEAGKIQLNIEEVDIRALGANLARKYLPLAQNKGLQLDVMVEQPSPRCLYTDPMRLQQVITNLISNALKFTSKGQVRVVFSPQEESPGQPGMMKISVADTGIGIPAEKLERVFEVFEQADGSTSRDFGGTGLGLSLSRKLTELLGGKLDVQSTVGLGSTFTISLPLDETQQDAPEEKPRATAELELSGNRTDPVPVAGGLEAEPVFVGRSLLLIDDDMRNLFSLARAMSKVGFTVYKASSADRGLELLNSKSGEISAVCMDIMMPEKDGYTAIRELRADPRFAELPIIAVTANSMKGDKGRCLEVGASDYVPKPVDVQELLCKLRPLLSPKGGLRLVR